MERSIEKALYNIEKIRSAMRELDGNMFDAGEMPEYKNLMDAFNACIKAEAKRITDGEETQ